MNLFFGFFFFCCINEHFAHIYLTLFYLISKFRLRKFIPWPHRCNWLHRLEPSGQTFARVG